NAVKPLADRMWANLTDPEAGDPDRDLAMDFDYIVKQWALGGYKLDADTLFWDEAQDVNPVMEGVVRAALDQGVQVVAVGDSNQAVYGFRGASDALAKLPVDARATLTQSFRFGPAVADVGNRFLRLLGTRMRLKGFDRKSSRIEQLHPGDESMVIARTNAGVALAAVQALTAGRTVAVSGGVKALQEFVQAAHALAEGEDTDHAELARFNGMAFDDIVEEVKADPDLQQLASLFNLLEKHGDDIDALLSSGSRPADTDLVGDRVWVRLDWNDPNANDLKRWLGDGKNNGVGKLLYDPATRRYFYEPGKREVPWKSQTRSGVYKIDNKLTLEEAQQRIDAHLAEMYPQDDTEDGNGRLVPEHEPHDVLVTTAHKAKGLESERVRIADDFKGPKENNDDNIDWDTVPDDEALRVAYVAVTRATEVLDPGSLGWVFRAVKDDDPTQPPKGEYHRDFKLDDFEVGDQIDFDDEDGTPNIGTVSEIVPPLLAVVSTSDEPGVGGKRQEIGPAQVHRRNGQPRPLLPAATDEELDQAVTEGRYGSGGTTTLNPQQVRNDLANLNNDDTSSDTDTPSTEESTSSPAPPADVDQDAPGPAETNTPPGESEDMPAQGDQVMTPDGLGDVMAVNDGAVLVRAERGTRVHSLKDVTRPDGTPFGGEGGKEEAKARQNAEDVAKASTHEGLELSTGNRLRDLDMEAGHGTIVDGDGNTVGWVRARIGDNGRRYWWGQDADGGAPGDMQWHEDLSAQAGAPPVRAATAVRFGPEGMGVKYTLVTGPDGRPQSVLEQRKLVTPDRAITEMTLTPAQVRELSKLNLFGHYADGEPIDTLPWNVGHRRYSPYSAQAGALAAAAREAAAQMDESAPQGRRDKKVLLGAARKMEFQQYDSARNAATIPAPGEFDAYAQPYEPHDEEPETDAPDSSGSAEAPETPAAEPFANDGDWRTAMVPVDAAELGVQRAANLTWSTDDTPGSISLLGKAVMDALAAQEDDDHDHAERRLVAARDHAAALLATLEDDERREMEEPLRRFLDVVDAHLARHRATVAQRRSEDEQRREIEEAAGAQIRAALQGSAGDQPDATNADDSTVLDPDQASEGDYVRVETQDTAGNAVVREGYLLAPAKRVTATRDKQRVQAWRLHLGAQPGEAPSRSNGLTILTDEKVERLPASVPAQPRDEGQVQTTHTLGWKGPEESRETVGEHDGRSVKVGEPYVHKAEATFLRDEDRRAVYLDGKRIGYLLVQDEGVRPEHAVHGHIAGRWFRQPEDANPIQGAAMALARADDAPILSFPANRSGRAEPIRHWAGVWAQPMPDGVRNVFLDRALAQNREGWTAKADPYDVKNWISTVADAEPLAQYDENTRRSMEEVPQEGREFLAGLAADLRSSVQRMGEEFRADLRPMLRDHIATRNGRTKALELRHEMAKERVQQVRDLVREQIARARAGAREHGLSEQQAESFLLGVVGGDDAEQISYGMRGEFPEALRPLGAAVSDSVAYWSAFAGWATQDDHSNWAGMHWENGRREKMGAPMAPFADARAGTGELIIGEAELPNGMRWARASELRQGDIFHAVRFPRNGTTDGFDGMSTPQYVIHTHRDGVEGAVRTVTLDSDNGSHDPQPDDHVVIVENPEPAVRKKARSRVRTDAYMNWELPKDEDAYELGGPDRVKELVARAEVTPAENDRGGIDKEWAVSVGGVDVGRIDNTNKDKPGEYTSEAPDGKRRVWHGRDLATAALVLAHEEAAGRDDQDDSDTSRGDGAEDRENDSDDEQAQRDDSPADSSSRKRRRDDRDGAASDGSGDDGGNGVPGAGTRNDDEGDEGSDGDGPGDEGDAENSESERRRDRRRRRRDRDRETDRGGPGSNAPNGGLPGLPRRDRDRDQGQSDDDRDRSANSGGPGLDGLKNRYRAGDHPTPAGAVREQHAAYLRRLADNDTLTLSSGGGLITWSDDGGHTWQFGHAASGMHLAGWEAIGDLIGGRDGAVRLADAYEQLQDENGNPIDWTGPDLDAQSLRAWRDAEGNPVNTAIQQARQNVMDTVSGFRRPDEQRDIDVPGATTGRREPSEGQQPSAGQQPSEGAADSGAGATPAGSGADSASAESSQGEAANAPEGAGDSQYSLNASHGTGRRGGSVDGRRVPTAEEMKEYETEGVINEEGERALFGSPERMRALAAEGVNPTPVLRLDRDGQIWRDGRLIGTLFAPHLHTPGGPSPEGEWWSETPWSVFAPKFASREAAVAHLVLRDKERGEPDLSVVHPDLAWSLGHTAQSLGFPGKEKPFRGLEALANNPVDLERYYALRALLDDLGRGVTPSGNVADDLAHLHDELRWLDATHYKHQKANLKDPYILGPGWLADEIGEHFDVLRPEDPRAQHHDASKNRAAHQFLDELLENGGMNNAARVNIADIREGDIVQLDGRITGFYPGYTGRRTGYVIGDPVKATFKASGIRYKGYRITVSEDPYQGTRSGLETDTFIIPADDGTALRLLQADAVNLPFDQHRYGRQVGEGLRTRAAGDSLPNSSAPVAESQSSTATATPAAVNTSGPQGDTDVPQLADRTEPAAGDSTPVQQPAEPTAGRPARSDRDNGARRSGEPADRPAEMPEAPALPEPVGGRPAEWVQVSDLQLGDLARIDGTTKRGTARTLAGHVVGEPKLIPVTKKGRATDMYRVLVADSPDARSGSPVYVMPDAAAARATRDDADQFQGSPQTGADSDVLTGRIADNVPTDTRGNGLFPGSLVTDNNGTEGVVTGASANSVRVQFGDDRTDDDHSPTSLAVTDGGAARPSGWTAGGHLVRDGNVVGDRDGNRLGTVEAVDGDTATVATLEGMKDMPISDLHVLGDTADGDSDHKVSTIEPTPAGKVQEGDVLVRETPQGPRTARVTHREEEEGQSSLDLEDTTTGETSQLSTASDSNVQRALGSDGTPPEL
ncbi:UvrD-helicase domain-containing protein, partial [[Kitasatospora] papulosa]|uniref:UvrD-helicase domain-containing protein n=1 Tax=[Kitasatospora] papulosa TaxID=1464011 RepID=UPI0036350E0A